MEWPNWSANLTRCWFPSESALQVLRLLEPRWCWVGVTRGAQQGPRIFPSHTPSLSVIEGTGSGLPWQQKWVNNDLQLTARRNGFPHGAGRPLYVWDVCSLRWSPRRSLSGGGRKAPRMAVPSLSMLSVCFLLVRSMAVCSLAINLKHGCRIASWLVPPPDHPSDFQDGGPASPSSSCSQCFLTLPLLLFIVM